MKEVWSSQNNMGYDQWRIQNLDIGGTYKKKLSMNPKISEYIHITYTF